MLKELWEKIEELYDGNIGNLSPSDVHAIDYCFNELKKDNKTYTPLKNVKDFFVSNGLKCKVDGFGWKIYIDLEIKAKYGTNANYVITDKQKVEDKHYIVLGYNKNKDEWVCWHLYTKNKEHDYCWGNYFNRKSDAQKDYIERIRKNYNLCS